MKPLRTELILPLPQFQFGFQSPVVTTGSCFSQTIGRKLQQSKFRVLNNPFGTVYNPISIHQQFIAALSQSTPAMNHFLEDQHHHFHYQYHSSTGMPSREDLMRHIQKLNDEVKAAIALSHVLIITYGTAYVYRLKADAEIVANCHKQSSALFTKALLTMEEVVASFRKLLDLLLPVNKNLQILLTVSPVRHLKDTLPLNSVSKSILRLACHELVQQYPQVKYFPAYELMMDDLRDYRFYKEDRIHPTKEATSYIWKKFKEQFIQNESRELMVAVKTIRQGMKHQAFHPGSLNHRQFLTTLEKKITSLEGQCDMAQERKWINEQLAL